MAQAATSTQRGSMTGMACSIAVSALAMGDTRSADTANYTSGSVRGYHSICLTCRRLAKVWLTMWNSCPTCIRVQFRYVEQLPYMQDSSDWPCETAALNVEEHSLAMWNSCPTCRRVQFGHVEQLPYMQNSSDWPCETAALNAEEHISAMWNSCPTCRRVVF